MSDMVKKTEGRCEEEPGIAKKRTQSLHGVSLNTLIKK